MSILVNADFELLDAGWTLGPIPELAEVNPDDAWPHSGRFALTLFRDYAWLPGVPQIGDKPLVSGFASQVYAGTLPATVTFALWGDGSLAPGTDLLIKVDGIERARFVSGAGYQLYTSTPIVVLVGSTVSLTLSESVLAGEWHVDDITTAASVTDQAMIEQIQAALYTKAQGISVASGYLTTPAVVSYAHPRLDRLAGLPALHVRFARWESDDSSPFRQMRRVAYFNVYGFAKDEDGVPDAALDLMRDIGTAIESDQTLGGLTMLADTAGRAVHVVSVDPYDVGPEIERGLVGWVATVRVIYMAPQGTI